MKNKQKTVLVLACLTASAVGVLYFWLQSTQSKDLSWRNYREYPVGEFCFVHKMPLEWKSVMLNLKSDRSFDFTFSSMMCLGYLEKHSGKVVYESNTIRLIPEKGTANNEIEKYLELSYISWGERNYLVPTRDLQKFCFSINSDEEPRVNNHGRFLLGKGDELRAVSGKPSIPVQYQSLLTE